MSPSDIDMLMKGLTMSGAGVALFDHGGRRVYANPAFEEAWDRGDARLRPEAHETRFDGWRLLVMQPSASSANDPAISHAVVVLQQSVARGRPFTIALIGLDDPGSDDAAPTAFAAECARLLRPGDHLSRLGSGDFLLLLPGAGVHLAAGVVQRLRQSLRWARPIAARGGADTRISFCAGLAENQVDDAGLPSLLARAERAFANARHKGRNSSVLSAPGPAPEAPFESPTEPPTDSIPEAR